MLTTTFALWSSGGISAQNSAVAQVASAAPLIEYAANESGGRIRISVTPGDSATLEAVRVHLLENAAAIRRGDYRSVRFIRTDLPAVQVLADRRAAIRCTFRVTTLGGELVLLSEDDAVVAAIHQLLAVRPPEVLRLSGRQE
jgi:hypothetical protein